MHKQSVASAQPAQPADKPGRPGRFEQKEARAHATRASQLAAEVAGKIQSGDLRGALARISFLMNSVGSCIEEINAALGHANEQGYLPPVVDDEGR